MLAMHPSHVTRFSDASSFDEVCVYCGITDRNGGGGDRPCSAPDGARARYAHDPESWPLKGETK